jgi:ABC-2 type transport system ATP-binding protein
MIGRNLALIDGERPSMTTGQPLAVDLRRLTKRYGELTAVRDLSMAIESGEIVAFLGPNGAGKTTTIDMMLGLSRPNTGSVSVYGRSPRDAIARGEVAAVAAST